MPRPERPLDQEDTDLVAFAADLRQLRVTAGGPTYRQLSATAGYSPAVLSQAAAGRKLPSLAVTLAYVRACGGDTEHWRARWQAISAAAREGEAEAGPSPYLGLGSFQAGDADRFFGRDQVLTELLALVEARRFVGVFGASGSGKSSLLRAGLVARSAAAGQRVTVTTPGPHPLLACPTGVDLLVVDQFEEVFTLCRDPAERAEFVAAIVAAEGGVVIGVRADFYGHCGRYPELVAALRDSQVLVGPMTADELREAVLRPAVRAGYTVETALLSRLVADAAGQPAVLPLVSHALFETWRRRRGTRLTLAGYEEAGGIRDAVASTAEQVYLKLSPDQREVAKRIFLRLTALGEGTEDTKRRVSHETVSGTGPEVGVVLEALVRARLLTLDRDGVEITHEALIRCWPRLREWLTEDRDRLRAHHQLTDATEVWRSLGHDPGALYRGVRLAVAKDTLTEASLTEQEHEFLARSAKAEADEQATARRTTRRLRQLVALLTVLLVVAGTAMVTAINAQRSEAEQRNIALARGAVREANALSAANPALARQIALAAYRLAAIPETRDSLLSINAAPYASRLTGHTASVGKVVFSHDGRLAATASDDHTAMLWDISAPHRPKEVAVLAGHSEAVLSVTFDRTDRKIVTSGADGTVRLWDVADPARPRQTAAIEQRTGKVNAAAFSPDGQLLATANEDNTARLWDITDPQHPRQTSVISRHTSIVSWLAFSPNGQLLATASSDNTARLWDITDPRSPRERAVLSHPAIVSTVQFSPDGHLLATGGFDHVGHLWEVSDPDAPRPLGTLTGHTSNITDLAFSPNGGLLATASNDNTARLWDITDPDHPRPAATLTGHTNNVWGVAFSPDGHTVATAAGDHTARVQDLAERTLPGHTDIALSAGFNRDGMLMASAGVDHTVRLWDSSDTGHPKQLAVLNGGAGAAASVVFSPDGHLLAACDRDHTTRLWDITEPRHPQELAVLLGHTAGVDLVAFSPDGRTMATSADDRTARLWDITDPRRPAQLAVLEGFGSVVNSVAFSPDSRLLAAGSEDRTIRLWRLSDPRRPQQLTVRTGNPMASAIVTFSPDGRTLATGGGENAARLWDVSDPRDPRPLATLPGHTDDVYFLAYSRNGHLLATSSADQSVRLWDVSDAHAPRALDTLVGAVGAVFSVAFHPDNHTLVTASDDGTRIWELDPERAAARICAVIDPKMPEVEWARYFPGLNYDPPCP